MYKLPGLPSYFSVVVGVGESVFVVVGESVVAIVGESVVVVVGLRGVSEVISKITNEL